MALIGTITVATTLLCLVLVDSTQGKASSGPQTCCMSYTRSPVPYSRITGFTIQTSLENCDLDAIIFYTVKKNKICAKGEDPWVRRILSKLSEKLKNMATANNKLKKHKSGHPVKTSTSPEFLSTTESSQNVTVTSSA